jgi:hypothetical protein
MDEAKGIPGVGRVTFVIHFIVALVVGLPLLIDPAALGSWFGYPPGPPALEPIFRSYGALILLFGGGTSLYGITTSQWERMVYIVRSEIVYLAVQTLIFLIAALSGSGIIGNWVWAVVSAVLCVLFIITHAAASG